MRMGLTCCICRTPGDSALQYLLVRLRWRRGLSESPGAEILGASTVCGTRWKLADDMVVRGVLSSGHRSSYSKLPLLNFRSLKACASLGTNAEEVDDANWGNPLSCSLRQESLSQKAITRLQAVRRRALNGIIFRKVADAGFPKMGSGRSAFRKLIDVLAERLAQIEWQGDAGIRNGSARPFGRPLNLRYTE